jgi:hypothetical protein
MGKKAPRRWYPILMIVVCIKLVLQAATSFRAASKAIHIAFSQFAAVKNQAIPTYKSISRWLSQVGLYKLNCLKEQANDWALIIDNSVQIGVHKFLVILGVRLSKLHGKALVFEDMEMLSMEIHEKSDAKSVCKALEKAQKKVAHLAPPNQRTKSRFLNIDILVHWGIDIIMALESSKHPDKALLEKYCGWVRQHKALLEQLKQMAHISEKVRQHIRVHGFCTDTGDQIDKILEKAMALSDFNEQACEYAGMLIDFCHEQSRAVPVGQVWVGSSEIIESLFGKLKGLEQDQSKSGFTSLVLGAAACVGKVDADVVSVAMRQVSTADVDAWTKEQMGVTILSKRRKALGSWRKKNTTKNITQEQEGILLRDAMGL